MIPFPGGLLHLHNPAFPNRPISTVGAKPRLRFARSWGTEVAAAMKVLVGARKKLADANPDAVEAPEQAAGSPKGDDEAGWVQVAIQEAGADGNDGAQAGNAKDWRCKGTVTLRIARSRRRRANPTVTRSSTMAW
jgi:hypothetical protein